jgi:hypothetical protein
VDQKPPWDGLRAAFYLVAFMLAYQAILVGLAAGYCIYAATPEILAGKFQCDRDGRLSELLNEALTAALAFGMAFLQRNDRDKK